MSASKTGADHVASLRDGRDVYIYGARVGDVTTHAAFRKDMVDGLMASTPDATAPGAAAAE